MCIHLLSADLAKNNKPLRYDINIWTDMFFDYPFIGSSHTERWALWKDKIVVADESHNFNTLEYTDVGKQNTNHGYKYIRGSFFAHITP